MQSSTSTVKIPTRNSITKIIPLDPSPIVAKFNRLIKIGGMYAAIKYKYLTGSEVITWIKSIKPTQMTVSAYRAVCLFCPEEVQLESDKTHFLNSGSELDSYQQIYILTHLSRDFYPDLISILGKQAINILRRKYSPWVENYTPQGVFKLLKNCDLATIFRDDLQIPKNFPSTDPSFSLYLDQAIEFDRFDWLTKHLLSDKNKFSKSRLIGKIQDRSMKVKQFLPEYWEQVVKPGHLSILTKLDLNLFDKAKLHSILPELCPELDKLTGLGLKILSLQSKFLVGYLLGFPVDQYIPTEQEILLAALNLSKMGLKEYCQHFNRQNRERIKGICSNPGLPSEWGLEYPKVNNDREAPANEFNLSKADSIYDFSSFDLVHLQTGPIFHFFTRCEFQHLLDKMKNPYNSQSLPICVASLISEKINLAKSHQLPICLRLIDTLTSFESDQIKIPHQPPQITSPRPVNVPIQSLDPTGREGGLDQTSPPSSLNSSLLREAFG